MEYKGVKRKIFISHYKGDKKEVDAFIQKYGSKEKVFIPYVLGANNNDFIESTNTDYVMNQIRTKCLKNTTVIIAI